MGIFSNPGGKLPSQSLPCIEKSSRVKLPNSDGMVPVIFIYGKPLQFATNAHSHQYMATVQHVVLEMRQRQKRNDNHNNNNNDEHAYAGHTL
jgi:hypothetical protein